MFWLLDYFLNGNLTIGFIFIIYIWIVFMLRWLLSKRYKPYLEAHHEEVSAIIPVYNENLSLFKRCLKSVHDENPKEIIVVINGGGENELKLEEIALSFNARVYKLPQPAKRPAVALGVQKATGSITLLLDSDTVLTKGSLKELLKPFKDKKVGGATSTQMILNARTSIVRKFAGWMEDIRFSISQRAQSSFGAVGCLPGRFIAFRRELIVDCLDRFVNERFLGKNCNSGDDRFLTSHVLKKGYKTIMQSTSLVYTNCPDTFIGFLKQQLRWARSSQRETLLSFPWLYKHPFTFFSFVTDIITPFFFIIVEINVVIQLLIFGGRFVNMAQFIFDVIFALFAMNLSIGVKQLDHFKAHPGDVKLLPLYSIFMTLILTPIRIYGFFTMADPSWHTRSVIWTDGSRKELAVQREDTSVK
ncbi:MAG: glycosyltransferase [Spirochaetes bacterium]|nr:glycosyltransferase [Spirochaetota bacterium]